MRHIELLQKHREQIIAIAEQNHMTNVRVFGSLLHGDDTAESDIDLIVDPVGRISLFDLAGAQYKMSELLGVDVDLLTPTWLSERFRNIVLAEARKI